MTAFIAPEWLPSLLVAIVALGMSAAFVSADYRSPTSRSLALALAAFAISAGLSLPLGGSIGPVPPAGRWLALADGISIIASLEWLRRVRRTIDVEHLHLNASEILLRLGQMAGLIYTVAGLLLPELRRDDFLGAVNNFGALFRPGFWVFAGPMLFSIFTGAVATLLLLFAKPDRSERIRIVAVIVAIPLIVGGLVVPLRAGAIAMVLGQMVFLVGTVHYLVMQGQRGQFLSRFLSPQVAKLVRDRGLRRAVQHRQMEITVVSCDMRGFTAFAQAHPSSTVIKTLRDYYDAVGKVVAHYGGTIKDYAGDGILVLVGAPLPVEHHERCGVEMARQIRAAAGKIVGRWGTAQHPLGIGVGVASGVVTVGIIGSASRWEYTAVGSAVNLASRLCEQADDKEVLIHARTAERAGASGLVQLESIPFKGFAEPQAVYLLPN
jgi:class 3 adenylate cyclase